MMIPCSKYSPWIWFISEAEEWVWSFGTRYNALLYWAQESLERREDHLLTALSSTPNLQKAPTECVVRQFWEASQITWFCSAYKGIVWNCQQIVCSSAPSTLRSTNYIHSQCLRPWPPAFILQWVNPHSVEWSENKRKNLIHLKCFIFFCLICDCVNNMK